MTVANARIGAVVIDCHDPEALFGFWSAITGVDKAEEVSDFIFCTGLARQPHSACVPEGARGQGREEPPPSRHGARGSRGVHRPCRIPRGFTPRRPPDRRLPLDRPRRPRGQRVLRLAAALTPTQLLVGRTGVLTGGQCLRRRRTATTRDIGGYLDLPIEEGEGERLAVRDRRQVSDCNPIDDEVIPGSDLCARMEGHLDEATRGAASR